MIVFLMIDDEFASWKPRNNSTRRPNYCFVTNRPHYLPRRI
ncbi:hypothetical protein FLJC2902T_14570 [Flavobacterium limnosediminis JC2902]|uniref:Uncharacterized protein n=1 Tax=Flavobacterium limnosediminis JC2902 TaxID=1341181 RepID=V6SWR4_9FLAO|nr:hypothetical protein FLJC2902T_14570 [Flavobacterium limnosediminis JC2902]